MIKWIPKSIKLIALGCLSAILLLEIVLRMLPVSTGFGFQSTTLAEPVLRATVPFVKHSLDWRFHQSQIRKVNNYGFPDDADYTPNTNPIAVIGDSYIQSLMLPYSDTLQGQLGTLIGQNNRPAYSFGVPGYSLAGYIGSAEYASRTFKPEFFVFLLTDKDITDSLSPKTAGSYYLNPRELKLNFEPKGVSRTTELLLKSTLMRYLNLHLQFNPVYNLSQLLAPKQTSVTPAQSPDLINQASTQLLDYLEQKSTARADNTIFIIDCDRDKIYQQQPQPQSPPDNQLTLFANVAQSRGYTVIDTLPLFSRQYEQSRRRLDFKPIDIHWNSGAHKLVAETIYPVMKTKLARLTSDTANLDLKQSP